MKPNSRPLVAVGLMLVAALMAACGSGDADSPSPTSTTPASSQPTGTPGVSTSSPTGQQASWCPVGTYAQTAGGGATSTGVIEGLVEFKGGTYCKIVSTSTSAGITVSYTYYHNLGASDAWGVMDINGQVTETHFVNGQVTETRGNNGR